MTFLFTDRGHLVNVAHVAKALRVGDDCQLIDRRGQTLGTILADQLDECVEQIIAPAEPYECLQIWFEDAESWISVSDVIAWALTATGGIYPISADDTTPKFKNYALRRRGQETVETPADTTFKNEAAWVASETRQREKQQERKAAQK